MPNLSPTKESFEDPNLKSNFLPGRKSGTKQVPRAVPIRLNMMSAILEQHPPPQYFVDLINKNQSNIDKESTMYNWFCAVTTWDKGNCEHSALQLQCRACIELDCDNGATML